MRTAKDIVNDKQDSLLTVPATTSVYDALIIMTKHRVGSIVVTKNDQICGIWTERDLMFSVMEPDFDPRSTLIEQSYSENLITADATEDVYQLYDKFVGKRIRHLLIKDDEKFIGLISVGDVMKASLREKADQISSLNQKVSLEYYENWKQVKAES